MIPFWMTPEFQPTQLRGCVGHFFDSKTKKRITVSLGYVVLRPVFVFRAGILPLFDNQVIPFVGGEISAPNATAENCSGSIVIPEQHTPWGTCTC